MATARIVRKTRRPRAPGARGDGQHTKARTTSFMNIFRKLGILCGHVAKEMELSQQRARVRTKWIAACSIGHVIFRQKTRKHADIGARVVQANVH